MKYNLTFFLLRPNIYRTALVYNTENTDSLIKVVPQIWDIVNN